jgi:ribonuclease Z
MSYRKKTLRTILGLVCGLALATNLSAQEITVTLLGTGNSATAVDRFAASTLVQAGNQVLIFDAGRGALQRLSQAGATVAQIDAVFFTHLHSDHIVGFPELWLSGWLFSNPSRTRPWRVFGPTGTVNMAEHLTQAFTVDLHARVEENAPFLPVAGAELRATDVQPGVVFEANGVRVTAITVDHRAISPAFGYRVDYAGRSVVLSGDTQPSENLIKAAEGADLLIHEIYGASDELLRQDSRTAKVQTFHTSASEAGTVFKRVHPKVAVYSHIVLRGLTAEDLVRQTRATYPGLFVVGEDLMRFVVGENVAIFRP